MATQVDKLILQTEGKERIAELTVLLKAEAEAMRELIALRDLGRISQARYDAGMRNAATAAVGYEKQIAAVEKGVRSFSLVGKNAQLGFMELSYVLQDFVQGGIGGILNNLPRVVTLFGGPIGLGAAVGAAGVAVFVFRQQQVELASVGRSERPEKPRAIRHGRAGNGGVGVGADDGPALGGGVLDQDIQLIGDRALVLAVRAVASVKGDAGHGRPPSRWARSAM